MRFSVCQDSIGSFTRGIGGWRGIDTTFLMPVAFSPVNLQWCCGSTESFPVVFTLKVERCCLPFGVKIDWKLVHCGFVTDRRLDTGNFNLKPVVLWIVMRKPQDKKRKGPIPDCFRIRDRERLRNRQRLADGCRRRHLVHQPHDNRTQHCDRELSEFGMRAWHLLSVVHPANA